MYGNYNMPFGYNPYNYNQPTYPTYIPQNQIQNNNNTNVSQTNTNKIFVNGIDDVKSRQLPVNSDYMFLDNDKPIIYQKVVDGKGQFEVKTFDIIPHKKDEKINNDEFVLKSDFDKLYDEFSQLKNKIEKIGDNKYEPIKEREQSTTTNDLLSRLETICRTDASTKP